MPDQNLDDFTDNELSYDEPEKEKEKKDSEAKNHKSTAAEKDRGTKNILRSKDGSRDNSRPSRQKNKKSHLRRSMSRWMQSDKV